MEEALPLDRMSGNNNWTNIIFNEMQNVKVAFKALPNEDRATIGWQCLKHHMD